MILFFSMALQEREKLPFYNKLQKNKEWQAYILHLLHKLLLQLRKLNLSQNLRAKESQEI